MSAVLEDKIGNPFAVLSRGTIGQEQLHWRRGHKIELELIESTIDVGVCYQRSITIDVL